MPMHSVPCWFDLTVTVPFVLVIGTKHKEVLSRNSRVHHMAKLRFNANSLAVLFTERDSIGVNTIPNVAFINPDFELCLDFMG